MPIEMQHIIAELAGWVIAGLLGINIFFVKNFMSRMERGLTDLSRAIDSHSQKLTAIDKHFSERITRLEIRAIRHT